MRTAETPPREAQSPLASSSVEGPGWRPRGGSFAVQVAVLSAAAGAIHLSVAGAHFDYFWLHGTFFVAVGLAQIAWAGLVLAYPIRPVFVVGAAGNALVIFTWVMSRTIGAPFGPQPWVAEPITAIDALATAFEVLIVGAVFFRLRRPATEAPRELSLGRLAAFGAVVVALAAGGIVRDGLTGHVHGGLGELSLSAGGHAHAGSPIAPDDPLLLELEGAVREGGAVEGMDLLEQRAANDQEVQKLAHQYVHSLARFHYDLAASPAEAFTTCDERFEGGCYHGVLQQYFAENPRFIGPDVAEVCPNLGAGTNVDLKWQCLHGLGHGLTLAFDHNLLRPLRYCDFLSSQWDQRACYGGVFMENVIWSLNADEETGGEGVIEQDLHYPCNAIDEKYRTDCWLMQTSTILPLVEWDFAAAYKACDEAGRPWVGLCYESMGRDIAGYTVHEPISSADLCLGGDERFHGSCFSGAAKQMVDYHGGTDQAFQMCVAAPPHAKQECYQAMGEMIYFYWSDDLEMRRLECAKAEEAEWVRLCEFASQVRGPRVIPVN